MILRFSIGGFNISEDGVADNGTKGGGDCWKKGKESLKKSAACLAYLCKFHFEG